MASKLLETSKPLEHAGSHDRLRLKIDNYWYDLTQWKNQHPGGAHILEQLTGQDATDAFYSLHSREAVLRLNRLHKTAANVNTGLEIDQKNLLPEISSFRAFRQQLEREGWFERDALQEAFYLLMVYGLCTTGTYLAVHGFIWISILMIGIGMQQAGWVGHDHIHGRGRVCYFFGRVLGGTINAFSATWWSLKHNTHHCYTNFIGLDDDIANEPLFQLFYPADGMKVPFRRYQHLYMIPAYSALFLSWRFQSLLYVFRHGKWSELAIMAINYCWLLCLPLYVAIGSILVGGLAVALVVTASHQSEEFFKGEDIVTKPYNFVRTQFEATRNARTHNFIEEYLWGGMQYQLEHHLFPTMPKYKYKALCERLQLWAKENNLPYKAESTIDIIMRNYRLMKTIAEIAG